MFFLNFFGKRTMGRRFGAPWVIDLHQTQLVGRQRRKRFEKSFAALPAELVEIGF
jgi:hypothetical protein